MTIKKITIRALLITAIYFLISITWIILSDNAIYNLFANQPELLSQIQTYKGLAFVFFTSLLIYFLSWYALKSQQLTMQKQLDAKKIREELAERDKKLVAAMGDIVYEHDVVNDHIKWQGHYTKMLGFSLEELGDTAKDWFALIHPEDRDSVQAKFDNPQDGKFFDAEYRILKKNGKYIWIWDHGVLDFDAQGEILGVTGLMRDINERKITGRILWMNNIAMEKAGDLIFWTDLEARLFHVNDTACSRLGYSRNDLLSKSLYDIEPDLNNEMWASALKTMQETGSVTLESQVRTNDGQIFPVEVRAKYVEYKDIPCMCAVVRDISERKMAEKALKENQARIEHLLDANPIILYSTKVTHGNFSPYWVSKSIERILGYSVEEASRPGWWTEHIHPEDRENCLERIKYIEEQDNLELEYRFIHKDGHTLWIRDRLRILHDPKGTPMEIIGIWNDITEYVETETKLRQIQKLDAIGQLTSGVAHDFNNRLTVILGNLQLLERQLGDNKELKKLVHSAIEASKAGATLTQRLLSFSRQQVLETEVVNVNDLVVESNRLFDNILGEIVNVELRLQDDLWAVYIDPNQMQEALLNLCVNAKEAMPRGGNLIIETSNVNFDYDLNKNHYKVMAGDYIKISVTDTGSGMSRETLDKAFEPFFTTKTRGSGTGIGLGLAMVYGFVKQSMGYINIYSEPGRGTCVNIYLPKYSRRDTQPADTTQAARADNSEYVSNFNNTTVLVVEDDTFVRNVSTMLLKELGCEVIEAENARDGLNVLGNNKDVDIVFSDMMMPGGMNGIEMINEMRLDKPDLRAIIVSGYSEDTVVSNDMKILWLKKPFTRESLVNKLNEALGKHSHS